MHIDAYSFGNMIIDGKSYDRDVIIHAHGIRSNWFRREGHELCLDDIRAYINHTCRTLVVGTGTSGMMQIMPDLKDFCTTAGIDLIASPTPEAMRVFNNSNTSTTVGAFHLTC